jgi:hypothetical protein
MIKLFIKSKTPKMKTHTGKFNNPKKSFIKLPFAINYILNFFKSKRKIYNNMDNNMDYEVNYNNYSHDGDDCCTTSRAKKEYIFWFYVYINRTKISNIIYF